jgi:hypothetical protein
VHPLTLLKDKIQTDLNLNTAFNNIIIYQNTDEESLDKYTYYNQDSKCIFINIHTLPDYQQYPVIKAFIDYYINNCEEEVLNEIIS